MCALRSRSLCRLLPAAVVLSAVVLSAVVLPLVGLVLAPRSLLAWLSSRWSRLPVMTMAPAADAPRRMF